MIVARDLMKGRQYLEGTLVLFCVLAMDLLYGLDIGLEVATGVLPSLQALGEEASSVCRVEVGHGLFAQGARICGGP